MSENQEFKKPVTYVKPSKLKGGEMFSGTYTGSHESESKFNPGQQMVTHYIEDVDMVYGINGTAQLNGLLKKREKGVKIDIEYIGKVPFKRKNGTTVDTHEFNVQDA